MRESKTTFGSENGQIIEGFTPAGSKPRQMELRLQDGLLHLWVKVPGGKGAAIQVKTSDLLRAVLAELRLD